MLRTREDLVLEVLGILGVTAEGQTPSTEDTSRVDGKLPAILAELRALNICYVDARDGIPDAMFSALADVVAYACRMMFGLSSDESAALAQADTVGRMTLRTINSGRPTYEPLAVLPF